MSNLNQELAFNESNKMYLKVAAKWAVFLAILAFVGIGFMFLAGMAFLTLGSVLSDFADFENMNLSILGVFYLLITVLYFFPAFYLFQFGNKIKDAVVSNNQLFLDEGLKNLKRLFKFIGILSVIALSMMMLMIPIAIVVGTMANSVF